MFQWKIATKVATIGDTHMFHRTMIWIFIGLSDEKKQHSNRHKLYFGSVSGFGFKGEIVESLGIQSPPENGNGI